MDFYHFRIQIVDPWKNQESVRLTSGLYSNVACQSMLAGQTGKKKRGDGKDHRENLSIKRPCTKVVIMSLEYITTFYWSWAGYNTLKERWSRSGGRDPTTSRSCDPTSPQSHSW